MSHKIKLLLVDDHGMVRQGIRSFLKGHEQMMVVGEAANGLDALEKIKSLRPDLALLDINLPSLNGFAVLEKMKSVSPHVKALMVTVHKDPEYVLRSLRFGARGYILKEASPQELLSAIESVYAGNIYITPCLGGALLKQSASGKSNGGRPASILSNREIEVLMRIAQGETSKEIAQALGVGFRTVQTHRERMMRKLNIHSVAELTRFAMQELDSDSIKEL